MTVTTTSKRWLMTAMCAFTLLAATMSAHAQTTAEIVKRGKVRIGVLIGSPPMGMVDSTGNPIGYDVDTANLLAKYMGVPVELTPLTPPARIPRYNPARSTFWSPPSPPRRSAR